MTRVVILGEVLVDLLSAEAGIRLEQSETLCPAIGGAPANVAVQYARLRAEGELFLVSAVGADPLGKWLLRKLKSEGIGTRGIRVLNTRKTGLTLIDVDENGERFFSPYRDNAADLAIDEGSLDAHLLKSASWLHTGTVSMRTPSSLAATQKARDWVRDAGNIVSVDVNLRPQMYPSLSDLYQKARLAIESVHVVKISRDEGFSLFKTEKPEQIAEKVLGLGAEFVAVTLDDEGAYLATSSAAAFSPAAKVKVKDATGAGDAFMGGLIAFLPHVLTEIRALSSEQLQLVGEKCCTLGTAVVKELGACRGMLNQEQLSERLDALKDISCCTSQ